MCSHQTMYNLIKYYPHTHIQLEVYAKNLEESLEEKTKCLENLEAAITGLSTTHFYSYVAIYTITLFQVKYQSYS